MTIFKNKDLKGTLLILAIGVAIYATLALILIEHTSAAPDGGADTFCSEPLTVKQISSSVTVQGIPSTQVQSSVRIENFRVKTSVTVI